MDGREETSIWKKEITFRRKSKPKAAAAPSPPQQTSIWKKEITFRRKTKSVDEQVLPVTPPVSPQAAPPGLAETSPVERPEEPLQPFVPQIDLPPVSLPAEPVAAAPSPKWGVSPVTPDSGPEPESETTVVVEPRPQLEVVSHEQADEIVMPPVTPPAVTPGLHAESAWVPPVTPPAVSTTEAPPSREHEAEPERKPVVPGAEPEIVQPPAAPPAADQREPSRREARKAQRAADRDAKERRKQAENAARKARKSGPAMRSRVVGLKVGASQLAAAEVINKSGPRIVRMARMPLDRGVVVGGEVRDPEALAAALKTFFRKYKLPKSHVRLGVSNNRIGVRIFEIAGIDDEKQLANAIRFRAQETLSIPLDEAVLDYRILGEHVNEGVRVRRVLLVVAHRELVERYVAACRRAGLKLIGIDLEAFALLRALADPATPPAPDAGVVCITIGHDRSTLAVSDGRVCEFTRVLAWGGSALDAAVARVLDLTPSAAEPIRRELSLEGESETGGIDARHVDKARRAIAGELQVFAREITASLRFYQEQPGSLDISEILVTGGAAAAGGMPSELERLIGVPVRVADPLGRVKVPRKLRNRRDLAAGSLAVAVGLGIED